MRHWHFLLIFLISGNTLASTSLSGGIWFNYRYVYDGSESATERDKDTLGDLSDEALILYVDDQQENRPWSASAELRIGPGSFTDKTNNSTGDNFTLHKAWIKYQFNEKGALYLGKSQVPFGWKTVNFWPGDMLHGGYGDQMDVGIKYSAQQAAFNYNLAYYHADDWGETSTDTVDDNGHWGSATSYRKIKTLVGDISYQMSKPHTIGLSVQSGKLQDLSAQVQANDSVTGKHNAIALYYRATFDKFYAKTQIFTTQRTLPHAYQMSASIPAETKTQRAALELGYTYKKWFMYLNASWAKSKTVGNDIGSVRAFAPGVSYNYGPGWFYLEYLSQNGYVDAHGDIGKGDFSALYASVDYYF
ncbi:porin [Catenovulum sediminis]|uniref:Porin n=1 Tax=Catenovulum sediminis TaxID=1740262 RepID=A0ABV1RNI2_9ALTE